MVMTPLAPAQPGEIRLRLVGAGLVSGVLDRVVDPPGVEPGMQGVPRWSLIGMNRRGAIDPGPDEAGGGILAGEHGGQGAAQAGSARSRITTTTWRRPLRFSAR